ncbi:hypothetical protein C8J55DRAFT_484922 [Lentinula edodes]|uniref:Uncharacterized protein n=1 Tax=Lentinula lateritia TaxID=40482 RepID=A0A9W9AYD0_9AGAR|nr:hypothetical protein C8J55DRAFT_484922 [Lentinula edodes]
MYLKLHWNGSIRRMPVHRRRRNASFRMKKADVKDTHRIYLKAMIEEEAKKNVKVELLPTLDGRGRLYEIRSGANGKDENGEPARAGNRRKKKKERSDGGIADQKDQDMVLARAIVGDGKFELNKNDLDYTDNKAAKLDRQRIHSDVMKKQFAIHDYKRPEKSLPTTISAYLDRPRFDYKCEKGYGHVIESDGRGAERNKGKSKVKHRLGGDEEMDDVLGMEGTGKKVVDNLRVNKYIIEQLEAEELEYDQILADAIQKEAQLDGRVRMWKKPKPDNKPHQLFINADASFIPEDNSTPDDDHLNLCLTVKALMGRMKSHTDNEEPEIMCTKIYKEVSTNKFRDQILMREWKDMRVEPGANDTQYAQLEIDRKKISGYAEKLIEQAKTYKELETGPKEQVPASRKDERISLTLINTSVPSIASKSRPKQPSTVENGYRVLNAAPHFRDVVDEARAVIIARGFSCGDIIPPENVSIMGVAEGRVFVRIFFEPEDQAGLEGILQQYATSVAGSLMSLLSECTKLSEGMNFAHDLARAIVIVDVAFANLASKRLHIPKKRHACEIPAVLYEIASIDSISPFKLKQWKRTYLPIKQKSSYHRHGAGPSFFHFHNLLNSAVDDDNKMKHNNIVLYSSNNDSEDVRPSKVSATTTKDTEWMTDDVKRTFIVQFRRYGTVKQRRLLNRKYKDVMWFDRLVNDARVLALNAIHIQRGSDAEAVCLLIRFCLMYTDAETSKDTIANKRILNEEANVSKEGEDNKSGEINICKLNQCSMSNESHSFVQVKNVVNGQMIMDQGNDIEYTSIESRLGQRTADKDSQEKTHMLDNSECAAINQIMDCTATIGAIKNVHTLTYDPQPMVFDNQSLVQYQYPSSVVTEELGTAYFPYNFDPMKIGYMYLEQ